MGDLSRDIIVNIIPLILHTIGLYFLYSARCTSNRLSLGTGIQYIYLVLISINNVLEKSLALILEINPGLSSKVYMVIWTISNGGLFVSYSLIMTLLTLDRFMEVYLNIRYPTVWSKLKTKICLLSCYLIAILVVGSMLGTCRETGQVFNVLVFYIWPVCEGVFIVTASVTYGYVIVKIRANRKRLVAHSSSIRVTVTPTPSTTSSSTTTQFTTTVVRESLNRHSTRRLGSKKNPPTAIIKVLRGFYIPTLFIVTFLTFWVLPDMVKLGYILANRKSPEAINHLGAVLYALAPISDALIYTFAFKPVRQQLVKFVYRGGGVCTNKLVC